MNERQEGAVRIITVGEWYDEKTLRTLFPKVSWSWWFGIKDSLLIAGRGHQFGFDIDKRKSKPFYLCGLSKGSFGDWTEICYALNKGEKRVILRTLKVINKSGREEP